MDQVLQYFKQAEKVLDANEFGTEEEYSIFMQNVFAEVEGLEYRLACSHDGSAVLEKILRVANAFQLRVFCEKVKEKLTDMCCHRYASHVVESWLRRAVSIDESARTEEEVDGPPPLSVQLTDISHIMIESFAQISQDEYGSHVVRLILKCWCNELEDVRINFPSGHDHLIELVRQLVASPKEISDVKANILSKQASPVLQVLLTCLFSAGASEELQKMYKLVFPTLFDSKEELKKGTLMSICDHQVGSRFMEAFIGTLSAADFLCLLNRAVRPYFEDLLGGQNSNFVLQCCISRCHNAAQFEMITEMVKATASQLIIPRKRHGILVRLCQWVTDHELVGADAVMCIILDAFHAKGSHDWKRLFMLIINLKVKEDQDSGKKDQDSGKKDQDSGKKDQDSGKKDQDPGKNHQDSVKETIIQIGGTQMLQCLVQFPSACAKPLIDSFLEVSVADLLSLCTHPSGSRVVEALLTSRTVSLSAKHRTVRKIRDQVASLAVDKYGSHIVDHCYQVASTDLRAKIVERLAASKTKLEDNQYGRIVLRNCGVAEFVRNQESWKNAQDSAERKKAIFADILNDDENNLSPASPPLRNRKDSNSMVWDDSSKKAKKNKSK